MYYLDPVPVLSSTSSIFTYHSTGNICARSQSLFHLKKINLIIIKKLCIYRRKFMAFGNGG